MPFLQSTFKIHLLVVMFKGWMEENERQGTFVTPTLELANRLAKLDERQLFSLTSLQTYFYCPKLFQFIMWGFFYYFLLQDTNTPSKTDLVWEDSLCCMFKETDKLGVQQSENCQRQSVSPRLTAVLQSQHGVLFWKSSWKYQKR